VKLNKKFNKDSEYILLMSLGYSYGLNFEKDSSNVQMGILYLGTVLKQKGYKVSLLYSDYPDIEGIVEQMKGEKVSIVGFYTTTENIYRCIRCARLLKRMCQDIVIIMGGPHASVMDINILETENTIDLIVRREGENILLEIVRFLEGYGKVENIKGITFRDKGKILRNPDAPFIDNLDSLPVPDRDLLKEPLRSFDILFPRIITGRGCPFKCAFCHEGFHGGTYRMRSSENVLQEVDYLVKRGKINYIRFLDDTFTVNPKRTLQICKGLREMSKEGREFVWFAEGRADILSRYPRLIYEMSLAGLGVLQIGVECAEEKILDLYQKNITLKQIEQVVRICSDALVPCISINFILGGPLESMEIYKKNLDFIRKLTKIAPGKLNISYSLLVPFPKTRIMEKPEQFGLKLIDPECKTGMTNETCFCESEFLNEYEITNIARDFDRDLLKIMSEHGKNISPEIIRENFSLRSYGIETPWFNLFSTDSGLKRFFNLRYYRINHLPSSVEGDFLEYYPLRTYPLNCNKDNLIFLDKVYGKVILDKVDSELYLLSSGKRTVKEIFKIAKEKLFSRLPPEEIYKKLKDFYLRMEDLQAVIFSKI